MKSIYEILATTPHKDTVVLRFKDPDEVAVDGLSEIVVTEEQIRWLQWHIGKGEYNHNDAVLISSNGEISRFAPDGRLTNPVHGNTMSLNDNLAMNLLLSRCNHE